MELNPILTEVNKARWLGSTDQCYEVIYTVVRAFQVQNIVEIGTHRAASTIAMCQAVKDNGQTPRVWTIDNWSQMDMRAAAVDHLSRAGFGPNVELVTGSSRDVLTKLFERTVDIDLVFIDGDHTEDAVRADWALSSPHAPLVLFHDAAMYAVSRVVDEAEAAGWNVTRFPTTFVEGDGRLVGVALAARKGAAGF